MAPFNNLPRSSVLLLGSNSVQSLLPATLTSQIESLLENRRFSEAVAFADQHRKRLQAKPRVEQNEVCSAFVALSLIIL
jgi:vacuolar protein sorting-associated protein 3